VIQGFEVADKLFLPVAIVTAAMLMPSPQPAEIIVELSEPFVVEAPVVNMPAFPELPETKAPVITVQPAQPVILEKRVDVPGPTVTVYEDREVIVDRIVEVPACIDFDNLPYFDLANAVSVTRPGEGWSLSGDYYNGLNWLADTPKPTFTEILGGWLANLEEAC
jgi:hypothetical protein